MAKKDRLKMSELKNNPSKSHSYINFHILTIIKVCLLLMHLSFSSIAQEIEEESKPLLRVFPIFRPEECEWSIRFDVCLRCIKKRERYAQRILFQKNGGPYREHGCYTDEKGFYILK